ncbi:MAG: BamA/TamA family outer membrane protein [Bacteroidales bacterium]|nr:BamA/TamA family outer membrane protein [Bacteroidales bacterium]
MKRKKLIKSLLKYSSFLAVLLFFFSCSPVKFVSDGEYLLNKSDVEVDNPKINKEEAKSYIRQKENYKILGFAKFHLWIYNLSSKKKTNGWLKRIGEPPQIYNETLTYRSKDQLKQFLNNKGYFNANVNTDVNFIDKKRKANVKYSIETGDQYTIKGINYHINDTALQTLFFKDTAVTHINSETPFDLFILENQRNEIVKLFRNNGYYYFSKENVSYLVDSTKFEKGVILDLYVGETNISADSSRAFNPYYLNNFYISILPGNMLLNDLQRGNDIFSDTVKWDNFTLYRNNQIKYNTSLFTRSMKMQHGQYYNLSDVENTFTIFNRLRQFRFIDIQFREPEIKSDSSLLDGFIRLAPLNKQSTAFEIEGTNTSGNLGIAGNINYMHRNIFKGAEVFQLNFRGAIERQHRFTENNTTEYFHTRELGIESTLNIPKLLGPGKYIKSFEKVLPQTLFTAGYNFQRRPEYTRTITNVRFGYEWMINERLKQTWTLFDLNKVRLYRFDPNFINVIKDLYIKSSFTDHFIMAMNYSFVYNTQTSNMNKNYTYLRFNIESAGNTLNVISKILNQSKIQPVDTLVSEPAGYYRFFNTRYAQYIKSDIEFRHGYEIDRYNSLVMRAFLGIGLPYGNFDVLPFEKKYFTGGANGIRAWQIRSLGPGTYKAQPGMYPNQSSDIKLEANFEYRFKLISILEGALFLDAGNIWAINGKDNRPGAQFEIDKFYKQIALGTGAGFRFDFSYFIFRLDLGVKLREPANSFNEGWIIGTRSYESHDFNFSFAIGYPF